MKTIINGTQPFPQTLEAQNEELKRRESALSHMVSVSNVGLCSLDTDLRYVYINDRLADINGLPAEDHLGRSVRELFPDLADSTEEQLRQVIDTGKPLLKGRVYTDALSSPGVTRLYELNYYANKSADGIVLGLSCAVEDITERERVEVAEREKEASDKRFRLLVERMADGVGTLDKNGVITFANDSLCQMFGYKPEELLGLTTLDLVDEENKKVLQRKFADRRAGDKSQFDFRALKKNGQIFDVQITPQPLYDENGDFSGSLAVLRDITEKKKSERSLSESEAKFRAIFDRAGIAMVIVDDKKTMVQVNQAMCEMLNFSEEELVGKNYLMIKLEKDRALSLQTYDTVRSSGDEIQRFEKRFRNSDGSVTWGSVVASQYRNSKNETFIIGMIQDVTERKLAETALRDSEEKFKAIFDHAAVSMAIVDSNRTIVQVNQAMCEMLDYSEEELTGKSFLDITVEEDRNLSIEIYNNMKSTDKNIRRHEKRYRKSDGSIIWGLVAASKLNDSNDNSLTVGMVQDITERKHAETALRESEERLRQLVENLNEFIYLFDVKDLGTVYASPSYEKIYGRNPELIRTNPQDWKNAVHPEDLERVCEEFDEFRGGGNADLTYRVIHPDGSIHWIRDRCFPIYDDNGELTRFAGVAEDITGRKLREERIDRQNRRLRQLVEERSQQALNSERLASVGRLTAGYTHQIRNPLQSIFCNLDRISALTSGNSPAFREITSMRTHLQRIADVAKQLSYVYRPQETKITVFNVNDIITEAIDLYFTQMSDARITISLNLHQPAAFVATDETVVYTALGNLILNAIDAMHEGGKLIIKTEVTGAKVQLSVADTGIGISAETMPYIFDPFFTTKSPDKGTGLGLTVVRESLESSGGSITASSKPGAGTVFTIHLPVESKQ